MRLRSQQNEELSFFLRSNIESTQAFCSSAVALVPVARLDSRSVKHAPCVFSVSSCPTVIAACASAVFIGYFKTKQIQGIFVVGEMGPQTSPGGLVKVPMGAIDGLDLGDTGDLLRDLAEAVVDRQR